VELGEFPYKLCKVPQDPGEQAKFLITLWEADDGWFVGYSNAYPDHLTQEKDLQIRQEAEKWLAQKRYFAARVSCMKLQEPVP
jgi:hypothetical protein